MKLSFTNAAVIALGLSLVAIVNIAAANSQTASKSECVAADGSGRKVACAAANRRQADRGPMNASPMMVTAAAFNAGSDRSSA